MDLVAAVSPYARPAFCLGAHAHTVPNAVELALSPGPPLGPQGSVGAPMVLLWGVTSKCSGRPEGPHGLSLLGGSPLGCDISQLCPSFYYHLSPMPGT